MVQWLKSSICPLSTHAAYCIQPPPSHSQIFPPAGTAAVLNAQQEMVARVSATPRGAQRLLQGCTAPWDPPHCALAFFRFFASICSAPQQNDSLGELLFYCWIFSFFCGCYWRYRFHHGRSVERDDKNQRRKARKRRLRNKCKIMKPHSASERESFMQFLAFTNPLWKGHPLLGILLVLKNGPENVMSFYHDIYTKKND